jgi:hypothetical protein
MDEERSSRSDAFSAAAIHGAEMTLDTLADDATRTGAPSDAELQDLSDRWNAAMAQARECMDAHNDAKAAGDAKEASASSPQERSPTPSRFSSASTTSAFARSGLTGSPPESDPTSPWPSFSTPSRSVSVHG